MSSPQSSDEQLKQLFDEVITLIESDMMRGVVATRVLRLIEAYAAKRELLSRKDELEGVNEHHDSIPLPWEVGTGPYIQGRIAQLESQLEERKQNER